MFGDTEAFKAVEVEVEVGVSARNRAAAGIIRRLSRSLHEQQNFSPQDL